jgi:DNA-binding response OmpR family regulator
VHRLLVVDDDAGVAFALDRFLGSRGFDVRLAATAERALGLIAAEAFDLVVLDLRLPGMSGHEALDELRRRSPGTPVIVVTAHGDRRTEEATLAAGAFAHLPKPFASDELLAAIRGALATRSGRPAPSLKP